MLGALRRGLCAAAQRAASHHLRLPSLTCSSLATSTPPSTSSPGPYFPYLSTFAASRPFSSTAAPSPTPSPSTPAPPPAPTAPTATPRAKRAQNIVFYPHVDPSAYHQDASVPVYDLARNPVDAYTLPGAVFALPVRIDILHRVVRWQRAKRQQGTHKVKDRSEVRGGGRKPRPQKGSGRSRQGSIRAPHWRGGGISHGPIPRSHAHDLPKKVRRLGLKCALSAKAHERRLIVVDSLAPAEPRTRLMRQHLDALLPPEAARTSVLLVDAATTSYTDGGPDLRTAAANIPGVEVVPAIGANVYSLLKRDYVILTRTAADLLVQRLTAPINRMGACGRARAAKVAGGGGGAGAAHLE